MFWPALNAIGLAWSTGTRRTSTRTRILAADLGYGWAKRGERFWVASSSPGLSARVLFYGLSLYNEGQVRLWPFPRANGEHTIAVLPRLRAAFPDEALIVLWDGAPYHRAKAVREAATTLNITLMPLPGYSPDLRWYSPCPLGTCRSASSSTTCAAIISPMRRRRRRSSTEGGSISSACTSSRSGRTSAKAGPGRRVA